MEAVRVSPNGRYSMDDGGTDMRARRFTGLTLLLVFALLARFASAAADHTEPKISVHFSPRGGCTGAVVRELDAAKGSVLVQAYSLTSAPIAKS